MSADLVFRLPDLGEGLTESEIVQWQVDVGDTVTLNQVIAEVETAKAMVELPSPVAGTVSVLHAEEGTVVHVGEPLVTFNAATPPPPELSEREAGIPAQESDNSATGELSERAAGIPARESDNTGDGAPTANLVGYGARAARAGRPTRRPRKPTDPPPVPSSGTRPPGTRRATAGDDATPRRLEVRGVRRQTAAAMTASAAVPQATVHLTCDVTASLDLLERLRAHPRTREVRLTVLTLVARAVCSLLRQHPALATHWVDGDGDGPYLERDPHVDLGVAVATDRGLVVPHVPAADTLSLTGIARALADLTATARAGRSTPATLRPGTLTITNVGVFGVDAGSPLLNPGETAILALGQTARRPWEHGGEVALRHVLTLSLTFDHRVVDGEQAARFLADLGALLTDPGLALLLGGVDAPDTPDGPVRP